MSKNPMPTLVTFTSYRALLDKEVRQISINPAEVTDIEDYCGDVQPGSVITLKSKKTYLVAGKHADIVETINAALRGEST